MLIGFRVCARLELDCVSSCLGVEYKFQGIRGTNIEIHRV